jgi:hypothetical protein
MVALKHNLTILSSSAARTIAFQILGYFRKVAVFLVQTVDYGRWFTKFPCFQAYADTLLLFLDFTTST